MRDHRVWYHHLVHLRLRRMALLLLIASGWAFFCTPVTASGGVHVIAIESRGPGSWLAREFIDNSLVKVEQRHGQCSHHRLKIADLFIDFLLPLLQSLAVTLSHIIVGKFEWIDF